MLPHAVAKILATSDAFLHEEEEILPPKELIQQYQEKRASLNADIDRILAQITEILGIDLDAQD